MLFGKKPEYTLFKSSRRRTSTVFIVAKFILIAFIVYELITGLFIFNVAVGSDLMVPLMQKNNKLLIFKPAYKQHIFGNAIAIPGIGQPKRGDIVVYQQNFVRNYPWYLKPVNTVIRFFTFQKKELKTNYDYSSRVSVSRIVGIPGDIIKVENNIAHIKLQESDNFVVEFELIGNIYNINTSSFPEGWDSENNPFYSNSDEVKIEEGYYFIMGDNREFYFDSRSSGLVPIENITGKVVLRYWPFKGIDVF